MTVRSRGILGAAASAAALAAVVVVAFVGASLVGGGEGGPSPTPLAGHGPTPPPGLDSERPSPLPTHDPSLPTQPADDTDRTPDPNATAPGTPDSITISDVEIPIPEGWRYMRSGGGDLRPGHIIWKGDSTSEQTDSGPIPLGVRFDDFGLTYINVAPSEEAEAETTLDALWELTQKVGTPSPPSLSVKGQDIPLPAGSYYSTIEKPLLPDNPVTLIVRLSHSVIIFDGHGLGYTRIASGDEPKFEPAIGAIATIAAKE